MDANQPTSKTVEIEIFRAGRHIDMHGREYEITPADVADMAASYSPAQHEAPLVIGHPKLNAPAYGWVRGLRADNGLLIAEAHQVDPAFAAAVNKGAYKKRSASFLPPTSPRNPKPGSYYLNHVGFLGAQPPAVTGLRDVQFAAGEDLVEFASDRRWAFRDVAAVFRRLREWLIADKGVEAADLIVPAWNIDALNEAATPDPEPEPMTSAPAFAAPEESTVSQPNTVDFAARERQLNDQAAALLAREQALAERESQARRDEAADFAASLVQAGKVLPGEVTAVTGLLLALPTDQSIDLAAADGNGTRSVAPADALREFLTGLSPRVDFREKSGAGTAPAAVDFAAPPGQAVDAVGMAIHTRALAYQQQHPNTTYLQAVKAVSG